MLTTKRNNKWRWEDEDDDKKKQSSIIKTLFNDPFYAGSENPTKEDLDIIEGLSKEERDILLEQEQEWGKEWRKSLQPYAP